MEKMLMTQTFRKVVTFSCGGRVKQIKFATAKGLTSFMDVPLKSRREMSKDSLFL